MTNSLRLTLTVILRKLYVLIGENTGSVKTHILACFMQVRSSVVIDFSFQNFYLFRGEHVYERVLFDRVGAHEGQPYVLKCNNMTKWQAGPN